MPKPSSRMVLSTLSQGYVMPDGEAEIASADRYIDEALSYLEDEEPSLYSWLMHDCEIDQALRASMAAVFGTIATDAKHGIPFERSLRNVQNIMFRFSCATAWNAVMRERPTI